ncbi:hypothetical protein L1887_36205 [Cichorium endivia]|nr:hypothetical protein L1887_36205 [Cichorium endivia]
MFLFSQLYISGFGNSNLLSLFLHSGHGHAWTDSLGCLEFFRPVDTPSMVACIAVEAILILEKLQPKGLGFSNILLQVVGKAGLYGIHKFQSLHFAHFNEKARNHTALNSTGFEKHNDEQALKLMNSCAVDVLEEFKDIVFAYGVSDEHRHLIIACIDSIC